MTNENNQSASFGLISIIEKYGSLKFSDETLIRPSTIIQLVKALDFYNQALMISKIMSGQGPNTEGFMEEENECNRIHRIFNQEQYSVEKNYNNITIEMRRNMAASYTDRIIDILEKSKTEKLKHNIMLISDANKINKYKGLLIRYGEYIPQVYQVVGADNELKEFYVLEKMSDIEKEDEEPIKKR